MVPTSTRLAVELSNVWHRYCRGQQTWSLRAIDISLESGELIGLLGPSGCGKTTLLRLIAGFDNPTRGSISLYGQQVAGHGHWLPPERRGVGMVFQDYALFPHLNAWQNTCFGLRPGQDSSKAVWLLELLGLENLQARYPHQLSGGQRQKLALARALAPSPQVVLLDEPFSNLDVEVRLRLRSELPIVLQKHGTAGIIVTHDPEEALAICDRVAVLLEGEIHQYATPRQLVATPATPFVGSFVLGGNILPAWIDPVSKSLYCSLGKLKHPDNLRIEAVNNASVLIDPDVIHLEQDPDGRDLIISREFLGNAWLYRVLCGNQRLRLRRPLAEDHLCGQHCRVRLQPGSHVTLYPQQYSLISAP